MTRFLSQILSHLCNFRDFTTQLTSSSFTGYLPHNLHGVYIELWSRLDPRLKIKDLMDRMEGLQGRPSLKGLSDRHSKARYALHIPLWSSTQFPSVMEVKLLQHYNRTQILMNTSMVRDSLAAVLSSDPLLTLDRSSRGESDS